MWDLTNFIALQAAPEQSGSVISLGLAEFVTMLGVDFLFLAALVLIMLPLGIYRQATFAVMKRNFAGYFSNPTGYVFLCLFVLLTSFAAFWPHEFFTTNLANFGQLNRFLPYVMLVFIPAITMSIWAEERRQGTDELLLTLPARDIDIVIGKYFAAVLVFTLSLVFSQLSNYAVLLAMTGGFLDSGILFSTYLGYWFVGVAMLSIGMVASFLTNNLTVGFIIGVALNAPLAFFSNADVIASNTKTVNLLHDWSLLFRFEPFGRGLISSSSIVYYLGLIIIGIYLSLILIGRRHWMGGKDGTSLFGHYLLRGLFLVASVIAGVMVVQYSPLNRLRLDVSREQVSTLSESTRKIMEQLASSSDSNANPIVIDAFIGTTIPPEYVQTKVDLENLLHEFDVLGGSRLKLNLTTGLEPFSKEAIQAEKRFGIRPQRILSESRGARREEDVILGAAISCGLERTVIKFFTAGNPVEYELIRAVNRVTKPQRKTIGIVQTDALPLGDVIVSNGKYVQIPPLQVIGELAKQYNVELVQAENEIPLWMENDSGKPISRRYDALVVIQPSKMAPVELGHLLTAINAGQPTAIFEDPFTFCFRESNPLTIFNGRHPPYDIKSHPPCPFPGTAFPRGMDRLGRESGDIQKLWNALGIFILANKIQGQLNPSIIWKIDNPYKRSRQLDVPELFILRDDNEATRTISDVDPATKGIIEIYFPYPGQIDKTAGGGTEFTPLVSSGSAGKINLQAILNSQTPHELQVNRGNAGDEYVFAARITKPAPAGESGIGKPGALNVVYVADIDCLADGFVLLRNDPRAGGVQFNFDNVAFFNNIVDSLTGETDFLLTRSRRIRHATLRHVETTTEEALEKVSVQEQEFEKEFSNQINKAQQETIAKIEPLSKRVVELEEKQKAGEKIDLQELQIHKQKFQQTQNFENSKLQSLVLELRDGLNENQRRIRLDAEIEIQEIQGRYKLLAVVLPVIPPLLLGLFVFTRRRLREREGISKVRRLR